MTTETTTSTVWAPQPGPQTDAIVAADWCDELFYGGSAGGGKSDFLLGDFLQDVFTWGKWWRGVLFRRTFAELEDLVERSHEFYPQTDARWNEAKHTWTWPNGAYLRFRYLERDKDRTRYQGQQFTWIGWDELTHWPTDKAYRYLRARLRSAHPVTNKRIRATANPGGVGHHWVKSYFVQPCRSGYEPVTDKTTHMRRMFVPAKLSNNLILLKSDPHYADRLRGLGSEAMVKAWLEGDWDIVEGAYFDCWSEKLIVRPFEVPPEWVRFRSMDWGSASPFSVGWWAVVQDDFKLRDGRTLPRGALVRYREWYGAHPLEEGGKGLKLTAEQVAEGIVNRERRDPKLSGGVLDPSAFKEDGGPSWAERINRVLVAAKMVGFRPGDNARVSRMQGSSDKRGAMGGWDQMRQRMVGVGGSPLIYCFDSCRDSIRTIPLLQHDPDKVEDVDTKSEDHAADEWRYACMSRPWMRPERPKPEPVDAYAEAKDELIDRDQDSFKLL